MIGLGSDKNDAFDTNSLDDTKYGDMKRELGRRRHYIEKPNGSEK